VGAGEDSRDGVARPIPRAEIMESRVMVISHGAAFTTMLVAQLSLAMIVAGAPASAQKQLHPNPPLYMQDLRSFEGKTLEQKIQELVDREEIRDLIATYAHRVAHGAAFDDLFTDDGVWTIRRLPDETVEVINGKAELKQHFGGPVQPGDHPLPMIHNFLIKIDGDNATGINSNELRITVNGQSIIASGYYEDIYRRVNGHWKFARRDTTFIHWVPIQEGWARPAAQEKK
jgi:ketosteroid isomerase-like protein